MTLYDETKPVHHILAGAGLRPYATYPLRTGACGSPEDQQRWPYQWRFHGVNVAEREARPIAESILRGYVDIPPTPSLVRLVALAVAAESRRARGE